MQPCTPAPSPSSPCWPKPWTSSVPTTCCCSTGAPTVRLARNVATGARLRVLLTNLPAEQVPAAAFGDLYHQRWRIEDAFKRQDSSTACIWRPSRVCRNTRCWWTWPPRCSPTTSPHSSVWPRSPTPTGRCSGAASEPMPMSPCVPSCRVCCWPSATSSTWSTTRCTSSAALFTASLQGALRPVIPIKPSLMRAWPTRRAGLEFSALGEAPAARPWPQNSAQRTTQGRGRTPSARSRLRWHKC